MRFGTTLAPHCWCAVAADRVEHWGLGAIARRMGVCETTILAWRLESGFLMYKRRRGPRYYWVTTDALIHSWELARCATDLRQDRARREQRAAQRATGEVRR
jgi:hypothetical protein